MARGHRFDQRCVWRTTTAVGAVKSLALIALVNSCAPLIAGAVAVVAVVCLVSVVAVIPRVRAVKVVA